MQCSKDHKEPHTVHQISNFRMRIIAAFALIFLTACSGGDQIRLITLDPGHFHAALVQKTMYPGIDSKVSVYGPKSADLDAHLNRIETYNQRSKFPTSWEMNVYDQQDYFSKFLNEKPGGVVVLSGNNKKKTRYILKAIENGFHVYADKPMVINPEEFEDLEKAFEIANEKKLLLYDIMTERSEITTVLQKELAQDKNVFGSLLEGNLKQPAIVKSSVHHFAKEVSGKPLIRPAWFFDTQQQGEGLVDVSAHLVDLTFWECFPQQAIQREDIHIEKVQRWTTALSPINFKKVTGLTSYPEFLLPYLKNDSLFVYANGAINYTLKGHHAKVEVLWDFEAPKGAGDTHYSIMRGTKSDLEILQTETENFIPTLYLKPKENFDIIFFKSTMKGLAIKYPGLDWKKKGENFEILIPSSLREGHEAHFAQVTNRFISFYKNQKLPDWERTNMLTKYYLTTTALANAKKGISP